MALKRLMITPECFFGGCQEEKMIGESDTDLCRDGCMHFDPRKDVSITAKECGNQILYTINVFKPKPNNNVNDTHSN